MPSIRTLAAACLSLFAAALLCAQTRQSSAAEIADALQHLQFDRALELLQTALKQTPRDGELWAMQGAAYAGRGEKKAALDSFRTALKISPNSLPALHGAIQIEYEEGDVSAIPLLHHALRLQPNDLTSHGMLAVLEYQQGKCSSAVVHFEKASALFDKQISALHAYAACLVKLRRFGQAVEVFRRALAINPDDPHERQLLASLQLMAHQPDDALGTLSPILKDRAADSETLELASAAYEDSHDTDKAVGALRQAILLDPQNVRLYLDFAALSSTHQSFQVGLNVVNEGIALQPKAAQLYFARGMLYVQLAEYDKAQSDFETAYNLDPNQSLTTAALGLTAVQQNDLDGALAEIQQKLANKPNDPILLYLQADILLQKGAEPGSSEFRTAMQSARKAAALRPALGPARAVLAKLYLQSGQYSEAVLQSRKAVEIDPKDQASLYHLIQALRKSGSKSEIPELLKRLAQLRRDENEEEREQYRYKLVDGDTGK